ncbi:MAG: T9SS type A sorting domain-containing protein [Bacteroidetes bacterium]|nr:T9SS type A sorting domain-containing protein [Bacteroidota bacterium]
MKLFAVVIIVFFYLTGTVSYSQWPIIPEGWYQLSNSVNTQLFSVYFWDHQNGWTVGLNGNILNSTNGGTNWQTQVTSTTSNLVDVQFTSAETGYAVGSDGIILKTTNSGNNWNIIPSGNNNDLTSFMFGDTDTGYISGMNETLLKTTNAGLNWQNISFLDSVNYYTIFFINSLTGWVSSEKNNKIIISNDTSHLRLHKTTDGGNTWIHQFNNRKSRSPLLTLQFIDSLTGWFTFGNDIITGSSLYKTNNGGSNWFYQTGIGGDINLDIFFINERRGWAVGYDNMIFNTTNGGNLWNTSHVFNISTAYYSVFFKDSLTGWTVGGKITDSTSGIILKTTTGGILTDFTNISSEIPKDFSLSQNYPNPFNPRTVISYELRITNVAELKVFDVLGNEVAELVNEKQNAGSYSVEFDGSGFASGIYFYSLYIDGSLFETKRMVLLK